MTAQYLKKNLTIVSGAETVYTAPDKASDLVIVHLGDLKFVMTEVGTYISVFYLSNCATIEVFCIIGFLSNFVSLQYMYHNYPSLNIQNISCFPFQPK